MLTCLLHLGISRQARAEVLRFPVSTGSYGTVKVEGFGRNSQLEGEREG